MRQRESTVSNSESSDMPMTFKINLKSLARISIAFFTQFNVMTITSVKTLQNKTIQSTTTSVLDTANPNFYHNSVKQLIGLSFNRN